MRTTRRRTGTILAVLLLLSSGVALAQSETSALPLRLLVVDGTKTFLSTMRVGGLVGALKGTGFFEVDVLFAEVQSGWHDPLAGRTPAEGLEPYDILVVIPRGIDDGTVDWVWVLSDGPTNPALPLFEGLETVRQILGLVFEGAVRPMGVFDDLLLGVLYETYTARGWTR